ncbi:hypothetical protein [Brevibacterium renqingii]|uniref:hypothetical protein n=1 Tax=Brevibacterium renqingii TaxID=2776916 RepID=UPI001ADF2C1E|nr:hypothetical protein [Brevibacterium renqingii]
MVENSPPGSAMKFGTLAAILGTIGTVAAVGLIAIPTLGLQPPGVAIAVAVLAGLLGFNLLSSRRQHRALLREINRVDNRVSRVEFRTEPVHDIRGSVAKTSGGMREALQHLKTLVDDERPAAFWVQSQSADGTSVSHSSLFAPGTIPASPMQARPKMHVPGRDAAQQDMKVSSGRNLGHLLQAPDAALEREIALVGGKALVTKLESAGTVTIVTPGMAENAVGPTTAFLVIDLETLSESPWRGVLEASGTRLYQELHTAVKAARKRGTVVVVHGDSVPTHFTASLEKLAHVRLKNNELEPARWGDDIHSEVIKAIRDFEKHVSKDEVAQHR